MERVCEWLCDQRVYCIVRVPKVQSVGNRGLPAMLLARSSLWDDDTGGGGGMVATLSAGGGGGYDAPDPSFPSNTTFSSISVAIVPPPVVGFADPTAIGFPIEAEAPNDDRE